MVILAQQLDPSLGLGVFPAMDCFKGLIKFDRLPGPRFVMANGKREQWEADHAPTTRPAGAEWAFSHLNFVPHQTMIWHDD
jgi:hypothetical protein